MDPLGTSFNAKLEQSTAIPRQMTVTENLQNRRNHLQDQIDRVDAALAALKENPEVEKTLNLIQQATY